MLPRDLSVVQDWLCLQRIRGGRTVRRGPSRRKLGGGVCRGRRD